MTTYAPAFEVRINGQQLPTALRSCITGVRYMDGANAADRVEVGIANPDLRWIQSHIRGLGFQPFPTGVRLGPVGTLSAAGEDKFDIDNKVELALGYSPETLEDVFKGEVTG